MTFFLFCVLMLSLYKIKTAKPVLSGYNQNYLDINQTNSIKGVFILLVFLSHSLNYLSAFSSYSNDILNRAYSIFQSHLGQGVVVMFLFYSGYGVMEAIKSKGEEYVKVIPFKRVFITWLNFSVAVLLYALLGLILGTYRQWSLSKIVLSFFAWDSIGNSNWYIFAIICLYLFTYISFSLIKNKNGLAVSIVALLTLVYIIVLSFLKKGEAWWFDSVLCYTIGMSFSLYKSKLQKLFSKKPFSYYLTLIFILTVFAICHLLRTNIICYEIQLLLMPIIVVFITMKISISNNILSFLGKHLFEIYILMRIPMLVLLKFNITNTYLFVVISFAATIALSVIFKKMVSNVDSYLIKRFCKKMHN